MLTTRFTMNSIKNELMPHILLNAIARVRRCQIPKKFKSVKLASPHKRAFLTFSCKSYWNLYMTCVEYYSCSSKSDIDIKPLVELKMSALLVRRFWRFLNHLSFLKVQNRSTWKQSELQIFSATS